ncbi:hypothetical protein Hypma_010751 [Hypsizygus marmoreus]|uniref:MYND-type domain-containing protein n=1 Tax=Hypsizygus marmoreus TaxID=39966 RepID=A0A369JS22_HYPMA|nr:hypothetical protein Hypma_010751 [Hypsizygus marmoreus]
MNGISLPPARIVGPMWSDDFAVLLGLKESARPNYHKPNNEVERLYRLVAYKNHNAELDEGQQDIVWARFCALYLPATVKLFLNPPTSSGDTPEMIQELKLNSAYFEVLVGIQHIPYFAKYLRSSKPTAAGGKKLTQALAERVVSLAPTWDRHLLSPEVDSRTGRPGDYFKSVIGSAVQLLSTLLTTFVKEDLATVLSAATKAELLPWLQKWSARYMREFLGEVCLRTLGILSGERGFNKGVRSMRKVFKNWDTCGIPTCEVTENLKVCGRCQTVRYCTPGHQRAHWTDPSAPHKEMCHKTDY